jgi:predicted ATPase
VTLYGGHDPRVCGLGQKGLSLWFKGFPKEALASVSEATRWAQEIGHVGSVAHGYDIAAMLHRYRRDYTALKDTTAAMRRLARKHELRSLAAKALIFDGWCMASLGDPARGRKSAEEGFAIQREIGTREDFPVYSEMLAEILVRQSDTDAALALLAEAEREAVRTGHLYWLPELCRRRALVGAHLGAEAHETGGLLDRALCVARKQNAATLFLSAYETAVVLGASHQVHPDFRSAISLVMASVEQGGEMAELLASISSKMDSSALRT